MTGQGKQTRHILVARNRVRCNAHFESEAKEKEMSRKEETGYARMERFGLKKSYLWEERERKMMEVEVETGWRWDSLLLRKFDVALAKVESQKEKDK
ncbi:unnamed protein product [Sphenostylis stenocarpa]|uniref:Uncharacterized protein n=1 Tax=Sphenostylis stenocarpa TaxID=92480 RepID=A0AA86SUE9_9FABA|nr:unnamed protein product [Sphenostylis stenocarpa]